MFRIWTMLNQMICGTFSFAPLSLHRINNEIVSIFTDVIRVKSMSDIIEIIITIQTK